MNEPIQKALLKVLKVLSKYPAKLTLYASVLGATALTINAGVPGAEVFLVGVGVNIFTSLLETLASGGSLSEDEIVRLVEQAISQSNIETKMADQTTHVLIGRLFRRFDIITELIKTGEYEILRSLAEQMALIETLREEFRQEFASLDSSLSELLISQQKQTDIGVIQLDLLTKIHNMLKITYVAVSELPKGRIFLSYARGDDEPFAKRLYEELTKEHYYVWWDRASMPNRGLTFLLEIQRAISESDRLILVIGPAAISSKYVRVEWEYALSICKPVVSVLRQGEYASVPSELKNPDVPDFRNDTEFSTNFSYLLRQLSQAPALLGSLINVPPLPLQFQPRSSDLQRLKTMLLLGATKPIVVTAPARKFGMQGMGGIGKTVLASALASECDVRRTFSNGVLWVTLGQSPNLLLRQSDLCRALGDPPQVFEDIQQGKSRLSTLLSERACLLILDDVWELEHIRAFEVIDARSALLITTRDERLIDDLGARKYQLDELTEDEAITLMVRWIISADNTPEYDEPDQIAEITEVKKSLPFAARAVARECGYLPLALALSAAQVRDGISWESLLSALEDANWEFIDHPNGSVLKSLKVSLDALEREFPSYVKYYLELAVFPEDVIVPEAVVILLWTHNSELKPYAAEKLLITLGLKALLRLSGVAPNRYMILHDLQRDYIYRVLTDIRATHKKLIDAYGEKCGRRWHKGPNDGYYFQQLVYHMQKAELHDEAYRLLTNSSEWMNAKSIVCFGDGAYISDLELALATLSDPLDSNRLITLAKLHTVRQVVYQRVSTYSDVDLRTLVFLNKENEALNHSRLRVKPHEKASGLVAIYGALNSIGKHHPELLLEAKEMLDTAPNDANQINFMVTLGTALSLARYSSQASEVFDRAIEAITTIYSEDWRSEICYRLVKTLSKECHFDIAQRVLDFIRSDKIRLEALIEMAIGLLHDDQTPRALKLTEKLQLEIDLIRSDKARSELLSKLGLILAKLNYQDEATAVFEQAYEVGKNIPLDKMRLEALKQLSESLIGAGRIDMAVDVMKNIGRDEFYVEVLSALAAFMATRDGKDTSAIEMFREAKERANEIQSDRVRIEALVALVRKLAEANYLVDVKQETYRIIEGIQIARDHEWQAEIAEELATILAGAGLFEESRKTTESMGLHSKRVEVLSFLAGKIAEAGNISLAEIVFNESRKLTSTVKVDKSYIEALISLAESLAKIGDKEKSTALLNKAREVATAIDDFRNHEEVLISLSIGALIQLEYIDEAKEIALSIRNDRKRVDVLTAIAINLLGKSYADEAIAISKLSREIAMTILDDSWREDALVILVSVLSEANDLVEARNTCDLIQNEWRKSDALCYLCKALMKVADFDEVRKVVTLIHDKRRSTEVLSFLGVTLFEAKRLNDMNDTFILAEQDAASIQDFWMKSEALSKFSIALAKVGDVSAARSVAVNIPDNRRRAEALSELGYIVSQRNINEGETILREAWETASVIQDEEWQAEALRSLVEVFVKLRAFDLAKESAKAVQDDKKRKQISNYVAKSLAEAEYFTQAFLMLSTDSLAEFVLEIARWIDILTKVDANLFSLILAEVTHIIGWEKAEWNEVYMLVS